MPQCCRSLPIRRASRQRNEVGFTGFTGEFYSSADLTTMTTLQARPLGLFIKSTHLVKAYRPPKLVGFTTMMA